MIDVLGKPQQFIAIPAEEYEHLKACKRELLAIKENQIASAKSQMETFQQLASLRGVVLPPTPLGCTFNQFSK